MRRILFHGCTCDHNYQKYPLFTFAESVLGNDSLERNLLVYNNKINLHFHPDLNQTLDTFQHKKINQ